MELDLARLSEVCSQAVRREPCCERRKQRKELVHAKG
jgi:hypothetical protein